MLRSTLEGTLNELDLCKSFTGYVHISNLKVYESKNLPDYQKGDSIFFSAKGVSANFAMLKLLSKTIEISEIALDQPEGIVIQNKKELNFTDLINCLRLKSPVPNRHLFTLPF